METSTESINTQGIKFRIREMSIDKIEKRIFRSTGTAIKDFNMIEEGDRILVAISGGKDSWVLLEVLSQLKKRAPINFDLVAVNIDQGFKGFRQDIVEKFVADKNYEYYMEDYDIASILEEKSEGKTPCSLCAKLRRGRLYGLAEKHKCNKIALGHHLDDLIETFLMNCFYGGQASTMAPILRSNDDKHTVIRPLAYVYEEEIIRYAKHIEVPIVCCQCPLMCGESQHFDYKRKFVKNLIHQLEYKIPEVRASLLGALQNINPSHTLDKRLIDFAEEIKKH
jgi:tRNA 2-thiocytidine biosynthesis protein TtcA